MQLWRFFVSMATSILLVAYCFAWQYLIECPKFLLREGYTQDKKPYFQEQSKYSTKTYICHFRVLSKCRNVCIQIRDSCNFIKKRLQHRKFARFLKTSFSWKHPVAVSDVFHAQKANKYWNWLNIFNFFFTYMGLGKGLSIPVPNGDLLYLIYHAIESAYLMVWIRHGLDCYLRCRNTSIVKIFHCYS